MAKKNTVRVNPSTGNVFRDLGFSKEEAEHLLVRADLLEQFDNRHEPRGDQFRYRRNQDGAFSRVGNEVLPEQDFLALVDQIEGFLRRYGQEIYNGDVRVAPYRHKNETACDYCEFRPICRFDPWIEPYRVLKTAAQGGRRRQT